MSIVFINDKQVWDNIDNMLQQVLLSGSIFSKDTIFKDVKIQLLDMGIAFQLLECTYFQILFFETLEYLVEEKLLILKNNSYFPSLVNINKRLLKKDNSLNHNG